MRDLKIINADVLNKDLFEKESFDLIVTSPPYNVGIDYDLHSDEMSYEEYLDFSFKWLDNVFFWSKASTRLCLNVPLDKNKGGVQPVAADLTKIAQKVGWKYKTTIIWAENNISKRTAWGSWLSASAPNVIAPVEVIIVFYKDVWKKTYKGVSDITKEEFIEWTNGLWRFNGESKKRIGHPAPFPRELPRRCIKLFSYVGDVVFDPFMGSGTTLIEALLNNRKAVGVDISKEYCELAKKRIENEVGLLRSIDGRDL
jgi:site-specific DNA-methyltransferase (adenine-specific)